MRDQHSPLETRVGVKRLNSQQLIGLHALNEGTVFLAAAAYKDWQRRRRVLEQPVMPAGGSSPQLQQHTPTSCNSALHPLIILLPAGAWRGPHPLQGSQQGHEGSTQQVRGQPAGHPCNKQFI